MQRSIKFSIIIPTYNRAPLLKLALKSLLDQTFHNWEALVIDNHSTDETSSVIEKFKDKRIKKFLIHNEGIIAKSRNMGLKAASGDWVAFLDSDDLFYPNKLEKISIKINCDVDFIYHSTNIVDYKFPKKKTILRAVDLKSPIFKNLVLHGAPFATSSVAIRRYTALSNEGFNEDPNIVASEDFHLWLKIAKRTEKFLAIKDVLGMNLIGHGNESDRDMSHSVKAVFDSFDTTFSDSEKSLTKLLINFYHLHYNFKRRKYLSFWRQFINIFIENKPSTLYQFFTCCIIPRIVRKVWVW